MRIFVQYFMLTYDTFLALTAFSFVMSITPGPNNMMLMASGSNFGFGRTIPHLLGVSIGFVAMILILGAGLIRIFQLIPAFYLILKIFSIIYLIYLAWKIANAEPINGGAVVQSADSPAPYSKPFTFFQAVLFQWVNPKAWSMALTGITVYVPNAHPTSGLLLVATVFGLINLPAVGAWALIGVSLRRILNNKRKLRIFNVTAALTIIARH